MLFNKTKGIDINSLKETDPEAYASIISDAKASLTGDQTQELKNSQSALAASNAKVAEYEAKEAKVENDNAILAYGEKLGVKDTAVAAVKDGKDFSTALKDMVDVSVDNKKALTDSFDKTASTQAGADLDDEDQDKPKNFSEAISMIASRDSINKTEALAKAKVEFKELLDKHYD